MFDFLDFWVTLPSWIRWPVAIGVIGLSAYVFCYEPLGINRSKVHLSGILLLAGSVLLFADDD